MTRAAGGTEGVGMSDAQVRELRGTSIGLIVVLVIQFGLGAAYSLYGTMPTDGKPLGMYSDGPLLAVHATLGLIIALGSLRALMVAARSKNRGLLAATLVGVLAVFGAVAGGMAFLPHGANGASLAMALAGGVAVLAYLAAAVLTFAAPPAPAHPAPAGHPADHEADPSGRPRA